MPSENENNEKMNSKNLNSSDLLDNSYNRGRREQSLPTQSISIQERLMIFIDGENLFNAIRENNFKIDYQKLTHFLSKGFNLIRVYYYTGVPTLKSWNKNKETKKEFFSKLNKQIGFLESLEFNYNFHVITKPLVLDNDKIKEKGIDVNIASDIIWHGLSKNYDTLVLISGDKDLMDCLIRMKDNGRRVIVANFEGKISREMKKIADIYINLSEYLNELKLDS